MKKFIILFLLIVLLFNCNKNKSYENRMNMLYSCMKETNSYYFIGYNVNFYDTMTFYFIDISELHRFTISFKKDEYKNDNYLKKLYIYYIKEKELKNEL